VQRISSCGGGEFNDAVLYYDCTNYYFEIEQEKGIRKYGPSNIFRSDMKRFISLTKKKEQRTTTRKPEKEPETVDFTEVSGSFAFSNC